MADGDKVRVSVELEFHSAAGALSSVPLGHGCAFQNQVVLDWIHGLTRGVALGCALFSESIKEHLGGGTRGRWVLAGDQQAVADGMHAPIFDLGKSSAELHELVLDKERHDLCQAHLLLLTIG